jgi:hypothetical protein
VDTALIAAGSFFVFAAIFYRRVKAARVKIPSTGEPWRQAFLAVTGASMMLIGISPALSSLLNAAPNSSATAKSMSYPASSISPSTSESVQNSTPLTSLPIEEGDQKPRTTAVVINGITYRDALIEGNGEPPGCPYTVTYKTEGRYSRFYALVGVSDGSPPGDARFSVSTDNTPEPGSSSQVEIAGQTPKSISMNISGANSITLQVTGNSCENTNTAAAWINPIVSH